jgi:hypothetical protein
VQSAEAQAKTGKRIGVVTDDGLAQGSDLYD